MRQDLVGTLPGLVEALRIGVLRNAQQDLRKIDLLTVRRYPGLVGDEIVEFVLGNLQPSVHLPLAQAVEQDVLTHVLAELIERDALGLETLAQRRDRHVVGFGDARHRGVDRCVVDADAGFTGHLQLRPVDDHALEHLAFEDLGRRGLDLLPLQLQLRRARSRLQLVRGDDLIVDHGHDPIDRARRTRLRRRGRRARRGGRGRGWARQVRPALRLDELVGAAGC